MYITSEETILTIIVAVVQNNSNLLTFVVISQLPRYLRLKKRIVAIKKKEI